MRSEEHLIYFSSKVSSQDKTTGSFTVNLPFHLHLSGDWKCAVLDFFIKPDTPNSVLESVFIIADFCVNSLLNNGKFLPILKKVYCKRAKRAYNFTQPLYINLKQSSLSDFDLTFLDSDFKPIIISPNQVLECTLHFSQNG